MNREQKGAAIGQIAADIEASDAVFAVDYRGLSVAQAAELRAKLRDAEASLKVVKNSLTERAAEQAGAEALKPLLTGPTALAFVRGDVAVAAKAIADFARLTSLLPFKGGLLGAEALAAEDVVAISRLPSREVLYGQLAGVVASPVSGLVRTLSALLGGLALALGAVKEKMESGELASAPPPARAEVLAADEETAADGAAQASEQQSEAAGEEQAPGPEEEAAGADGAAQASEQETASGDAAPADEGAAPVRSSDQPADDNVADDSAEAGAAEASKED